MAAGGAGAWVEGLPPMSARHAANTPTTTASASAAAHALRRTGWATPRGTGWTGDMTGGLNGSSAGLAVGGTGPMLGCGAGAGASASAGVTAGVGGGKPFAGSSGGLGGPDGGLMLGEGTTGGSRAAASANERGFAAISPWLASVLKPLTSPASRFRSFRMNHNGGRGQPASARQRGCQASASPADPDAGGNPRLRRAVGDRGADHARWRPEGRQHEGRAEPHQARGAGEYEVRGRRSSRPNCRRPPGPCCGSPWDTRRRPLFRTGS